MPMVLREFKPMVRNSLRGFATLELPNGLVISDVTLCTSNGRSWAAMPSKAQIDRDGQAKKDASGKIQYVRMLQWRDRETQDKWSDAVCDLIRQKHPDAL